LAGKDPRGPQLLEAEGHSTRVLVLILMVPRFCLGGLRRAKSFTNKTGEAEN